MRPMKIKSVKLYNFSSYVGECEINLDTVPGKNVILIGGNNGAGKTSLFTAVKLALYGPQCFRFQDRNNQYTARLRGLINHDAFLSADMRSFVELRVGLPVGRHVTDYTIRREWFLQEKSLGERFTVLAGDTQLGEQDLDFFQNYLFTVIPPNMFDLFFFDGEEVGKSLSSGRHRQFLKEAVLTLSGFDTFGLLQKFCRTFVSSEQEAEEFAGTARQLKETDDGIAALEELIEREQARLEDLRVQHAQRSAERTQLEAGFSRSGGLREDQRREIESELTALDGVKTENSRKIRGFVETLMPVFITRDLAGQAQKQLHDEKLVRQYENVQALLSPAAMRQIIQDIPGFQAGRTDALADALAGGIADHLRPDVDLASFSRIHDLSEEQEQQVSAIMTNLRNFSSDDMVAVCRTRADASERYDTLTKKLRSAMSQSEAEEYDGKLSRLSAAIHSMSASIGEAEARLEQAKADLKRQTAARDRLGKALQQQSRYQTAYVYTDRIRRMMEQLLSSAAKEKRGQIAELSLRVFRQIIRKDDYIHLVELDDDFNVYIYKKQRYTLEELSALMRNIGPDAFERRLGVTGADMAARALGLPSRQELYASLSKRRDENQLSLDGGRELELYSRIDLEQFSKGEKQVFVLSLYWAIIKTSRRRIPFIIDTPFARIDTEHRAQLSRIFFPEISDQVIVLSTDEEVVGHYREILKPFTAREYLLEYDAGSSRTNVRPGYFNEVRP